MRVVRKKILEEDMIVNMTYQVAERKKGETKTSTPKYVI